MSFWHLELFRAERVQKRKDQCLGKRVKRAPANELLGFKCEMEIREPLGFRVSGLLVTASLASELPKLSQTNYVGDRAVRRCERSDNLT